MHTTTDALSSRNTAHRCLFGPAREAPEHIALVVARPDGASMEVTFATLDQRVRSVAAGLVARGAQRGDRIVVALDDVGDHLTAVFAAMAAGLVAVPFPSGLSREEAALRVADADPVLVVRTLADLVDTPPLDAPVAITDDDPALLMHTSGTSATPKGVLHAHRALAARRVMHDAWTDIRAHDRVLHTGRLGWTYTLGVGAIDPWSVGATAVHLAERPSSSAWPEIVARSGATIMAAVPTVYRQILKYAHVTPGAPTRSPLGAAFGRLRHALAAGETLRPEVYAAWRAATGLPLYEALGMTELSTYVSTGPTIPPRPGSAGKPQPGRRVTILPLDPDDAPCVPGEVGLLAAHRGDPGLMLGYWRRPEEDAKVYRGEWFVGGDLASMDDDGYVWFHGRADEVMNAFGHRVSPAEVEAVLARHPDVAEVAVTELALRDDASVIAAFVVSAPGASPTSDAVLAFAAEHLSVFKRPREVRFVTALPRSATGKLLRRTLRDLPFR